MPFVDVVVKALELKHVRAIVKGGGDYQCDRRQGTGAKILSARSCASS